jgi:hypothetical protein
MQRAKAAPPWKKKRKNTGKSKKKMTDAQVARARARAEKAGRPYPNLIDNMAILREDSKFQL